MPTIPNLRNKVEALKLKKKLSFNKLSMQIGMTESAFLRILDRNDCKVSTLFKLAEVLEVSVVELLLEDKELDVFNNQKTRPTQAQSDSLAIDLNSCREKVILLEELLKAKNELIVELRKTKE